MESETILLDHNLRNIQVYTKNNYCISFGDDGSYNLYNFDNGGQWIKIITVNCSQWETRGLITARIDVNASNILTLSHHGDFMCTSFKYILSCHY